MKATIILERDYTLCEALQIEPEGPEGIYIASVEAETLQDCVDDAVKEVVKVDALILGHEGYIGRARSGLLEDAYTLVAAFAGHPELLQHGGVTHNLL